MSLAMRERLSVRKWACEKLAAVHSSPSAKYQPNTKTPANAGFFFARWHEIAALQSLERDSGLLRK